jgi:hypothetical protein
VLNTIKVEVACLMTESARLRNRDANTETSDGHDEEQNGLHCGDVASNRVVGRFENRSAI